MESLYGEKAKVINGVQSADMNASSATGARYKMDEAYRVAIIVHFNAGLGAVDVTLRQHDAAAAGNSKDLVNGNHSFLSLDGADFSKIINDPAAANYTPAGVASAYGIFELEVLPEQMDHENGFSYLSVDVADSAAAKIIGINYHAYDLKVKPVV